MDLSVKEIEEHYQRIIAAVSDYVYSVRIGEGRPVETIHGSACLEVTGYTSAEFIADPYLWFRMVLPEDRAAVQDNTRRLLSGEDPGAFEHRIMRKDGVVRWVRNTPIPHRNEQGQLLSYDGLIRDVTERRMAEERLKESESLFRSIVENTHDGILIVDDNYRIIYGNPEMERISGYTCAEAIGRDFSTFIDESTFELGRERYVRRQKGESVPSVYEVTIIAKDGRRVYGEVHAAIFMDAAGQVRSVVHFLDITKHKLAQEKLHESEERFKVQYQVSPVPTFTWQKIGPLFVLMDYNHAAYVLTDGQVDRFLGQSSAQMYQDRPDISADLERCYLTREVQCKEIQSLHFMPGRRVIITYAFVPPDLVMVHAEDITDRRRAEQALKESEEKYRALVENARVTVLQCDTSGIVTFMNEFGLQFFGYAEEELIGRNIVGTIVPETEISGRDQVKMITEICRDPARFSDNENENVTRNGQRVWIRWSNKPVLDEAGRLIGILSIGSDITERKRAEDLLRHERDFTRNLIDSSPAFIVTIDADGRTRMMNQAMLAALGYDPAELNGKDYRTTLVPESEHAALAEVFNRIINLHQVTVNENRVRTKDGRELLIEWHGCPVFDENGKLDYFLGVGIDITERKRAEERLKTANKQLEDIIEFLPDATFIIDSDKKIIAWNRTMEEITGISKAAMLGKDHYQSAVPFYGKPRPFLMDLVGMDDNELAQKYTNIKRIGATLQGEAFTPALYNNRGAYVFAAACPLLDSHGQVIGVIESIRDITERKMAEEALRASELQYRELMEQAADGIFVLDVQGRFLLVNSKTCSMLGYTEEELLQRNILDTYPPAIREQGMHRLAWLRGGENLRFERPMQRKDSSVFMVEASATKLHDGRLQAIIHDISERKRAEGALRESEEKFRSIVESSPMGMYLFRLEEGGRLILTSVNPAADRIIGIDHQSLLGKTIEEAFPNLAGTHIPHMYRDVAMNTLAPQSFETTYADERFNGTYEVTVFRTGPQAICVDFTDITARKQAQAELEDLDRELKRKNQELESIVYATSHDLRSPLLNIQGFGKRLEKACEDLMGILTAPGVPSEIRSSAGPLVEETIPKALKFIRSSVEKMDSLIKGLLQLSRLGRAVLSLGTVDLTTLLNQVTTAMGFQIQEAGARIEIGDLRPCRCDASQMSQVFSNLIDNALKYRSPERVPLIRVFNEIQDRGCVYIVEDNGVGIPEEHREKIWELFHRLEPGGLVSGEGLGLTVVRRIIERHGGRIWVESGRENGARFCFVIKQRQEQG